MRNLMLGVVIGSLLSGAVGAWALDQGFLNQRQRDMMLQQQQFENFNNQVEREQRQYRQQNPC